MDRVLASRLGFQAVEGLLAGKKNAMVGIVNNKVKFTPFKAAISKEKAMDKDLLRMAEILALWGDGVLALWYFGVVVTTVYRL